MSYNKLKVQHKKTTPVNLLPSSTLSRRILKLTNKEYEGATYCYVNQGYKTPKGLEQKIHFRKMNFVWGRLRIARVEGLDKLPIEMLRDMLTTIEVERGLKEYIYNFEGFEDYKRLDVDIKRGEELKLKSADEFVLCFPVRCPSFSQKGSSAMTYPAKGTYTYLDRITFKYTEGIVPPPRVDAIITYVPEGHYYILSGGIIAGHHLPQKISKELLESLRTEALIALRTSNEETKSYQSESEQIQTAKAILKPWYNEVREECLFQSEDIWKYHILEKRWELIAPSCLSFFDSSEEPQAHKLQGGLLHSKMKKVYYWKLVRKFDPQKIYLQELSVIEFDLQTSGIRKIAIDMADIMSQTLKLSNSYSKVVPDFSSPIKGVIDLSNDTLVFFVNQYHGWFIVLCLETYKQTSLACKYSLYNRGHRLFTLMNNFNTLVIFEEGPSSIYDQTNRSDHTEFTVQIDWGSVKKKRINPFLNRVRTRLKESMIPYYPKTL